MPRCTRVLLLLSGLTSLLLADDDTKVVFKSDVALVRVDAQVTSCCSST